MNTGPKNPRMANVSPRVFRSIIIPEKVLPKLDFQKENQEQLKAAKRIKKYPDIYARDDEPLLISESLNRPSNSKYIRANSTRRGHWRRNQQSFERNSALDELRI